MSYDNEQFRGSSRSHDRTEEARLTVAEGFERLKAQWVAQALLAAAEAVEVECTSQRGPCFCGSATWLRERAAASEGGES